MDDILWIQGKPEAKLAIVIRPRDSEWLETDLRRFRRAGVDTLVSLLEEDEAEMLGLAEEGAAAERLGMTFLSYPIPDARVPDDAESFREFVIELAERIRNGEQIGVHCRASVGRSTVTAACTLIHLGWQPKAALKAIEQARGCSVPNTREQERWILRYKARS